MKLSTPGRLTVALINDYEIVVQGLSRMFERYPALHVVELDSQRNPTQPVDIALYDAFGTEGGAGRDIKSLVADGNVGHLAVYSWVMDEGHIADALAAGVRGYLSKALRTDALVEALLRIHQGELVVMPEPGLEEEIVEGNWPGRGAGLTPRESEVVALIAQGLTNDAIAKQCFLSINSVKSYIRSAYRKMGVERRSQAILWCLDHGFRPRPIVTRLADPA